MVVQYAHTGQTCVSARGYAAQPARTGTSALTSALVLRLRNCSPHMRHSCRVTAPLARQLAHAWRALIEMVSPSMIPSFSGVQAVDTQKLGQKSHPGSLAIGPESRRCEGVRVWLGRSFCRVLFSIRPHRAITMAALARASAALPRAARLAPRVAGRRTMATYRDYPEFTVKKNAWVEVRSAPPSPSRRARLAPSERARSPACGPRPRHPSRAGVRGPPRKQVPQVEARWQQLHLDPLARRVVPRRRLLRQPRRVGASRGTTQPAASRAAHRLSSSAPGALRFPSTQVKREREAKNNEDAESRYV